MYSEFYLGFSEHVVHAVVVIHPIVHRVITIHHSGSESLVDLVLQTDEAGKPQIFGKRGILIKSRTELHQYWPTGWRCFKNIIEFIEHSMETDLFFTRAIKTLAP